MKTNLLTFDIVCGSVACSMPHIHNDIYKAVSVFTREGEDFLIVEQTEAIVSDAGKDAVGKEKAVARNVKSINKYKLKVEFGDDPMEDLMVFYVDWKASLKFR